MNVSHRIPPSQPAAHPSVYYLTQARRLETLASAWLLDRDATERLWSLIVGEDGAYIGRSDAEMGVEPQWMAPLSEQHLILVHERDSKQWRYPPLTCAQFIVWLTTSETAGGGDAS